MNSNRVKMKSDRIKVAVVLMQFGYGGAERMVSLIVSHFDLSKFDVRVFCVYGNPLGNIMESMVIGHGVPIEHLGKGKGFSLKGLLAVWKALSAFSPDVVHTHLSACVYCAPWVIVHKPIMLHTLHNVPENELGSLKRFVMRFMYKFHKAVPVTISDSNRSLTAKYYGLASSRVETIVNPVDIKAFQNAHPADWSKRTWDFICVARLAEQKNHKMLVEAAASLIRGDEFHSGLDARIALVGIGPLEDSIRALIKEHGLANNIELLGKRDDVAELLHDSKGFVLSSLYEGLPMTVLEAMAAGLPVIATSVGGVPDIIDGNGILVKSGDTDALVRAMRLVIGDIDKRATMSKRSLELVCQYDVENVARRYEELYETYSR